MDTIEFLKEDMQDNIDQLNKSIERATYNMAAIGEDFMRLLKRRDNCQKVLEKLKED